MTGAPQSAAARSPAPAVRPVFGSDGLPPLHVPLRFFLTAAAFGGLAGLAWIAEGEAAFATRWSLSMLGATHLLTLGFFTMVMFGALFQVIPVLSGAGIPHAVAVANVVHPGLTAGTLCLAVGLWRARSGWLLAAMVLLACTFAVFVAAVGRRLLACRAPALRPLRWALLAFVSTIGVGFTMAVALVAPELGIEFRAWTNVHAVWGGMGFAFLLVVGVSHQVVPMFHVTPPFPKLVVAWTAPALGVGLGLLAVPVPAVHAVGVVVVTSAGLLHVVTTLRLLARRRRRRPDATVLAWQCGLMAAGAALLLAAGSALLPEACTAFSFWSNELFVGLLFALGGLGTIVLGMLAKVVSFLAFLHLQRRCLRAPLAAVHLPSMDDFVRRHEAFAQLVVHLLAVVVVLLATGWPVLGPLAGAVLAGDFLLCFVILALAANRYRRAARSIAAAL